MGIYDIGQQVRLRAKFGTNLTELSARAAAGALTISLRDATGYVGSGVILIEADADTEEIATIASVAGNVVTLTTALVYAHQQGEPVMILADPTTITLRHRDPADVVVVYTYALATVIKDAVGRYHVLRTAALAGDHLTRWEGTGTVVTAAERRYTVRASAFV